MRLPHKWKQLDLDGDKIAVSGDGQTTAWIEDLVLDLDGPAVTVLAVGDKEGVAQGYVPLDVLDALRKLENA